MKKKKKLKADLIKSPRHYTQGSIQPWDFIISQDMDFLSGSIIKYVTRFKHKNGVEDLHKAQAFLIKLIETENKK